jgi:hypothetical protein
MRRTSGWLATLIAAGGVVLSGTNQASADLIETTADSYFTASALNSSVSPDGTKVSIGLISPFTITYTGASYGGSGDGPIKLGTFELGGDGLSGGIPLGDVRFHLVVTQTEPSAGSGGAVSDLSGYLIHTIFGTWDTLQLKFDSNTFTAPAGSPNPVTYTLQGLGSDNTFNLTYPTSTLYAEVNLPAAVATPEPSSLAIAGIGALAGCGYSWRRRRRDAA